MDRVERSLLRTGICAELEDFQRGTCHFASTPDDRSNRPVSVILVDTELLLSCWFSGACMSIRYCLHLLPPLPIGARRDLRSERRRWIAFSPFEPYRSLSPQIRKGSH
ncbi:hypothetical protein LIA77_01111 [Sarocladium implicatum]|jgi:hypothetical protein|nr:hypothetical protein LIA77_01111 [Sarocladium implicatum]